MGMFLISVNKQELGMKLNKLMKKGGQLATAAAIVSLISVTHAYAQSAAPIEGVINWVVQVLTGTLAKSLAVVAVAACGYLAMTGRMMWGFFLSVFVGIGIVFGAATLVDVISGAAGG
jgi:type IV secretion system protein VirB2